MKKNLRNIALSTLAVALTGALASPATAQSSSGAAAPPGASTIVIPLFGVSMVINVVTDDAGGFVSAAITPIAAPAPAPQATITDPSTGITTPVPADQPAVFVIKFDSGAQNAEVSVHLDDGTSVRTNKAADAGEVQWVGDPLGNGDIVVVGYTAGTDSAGALTLTIESINGKAPADLNVVESAGEITWYQVLAPTINAGNLIQFITFFDAPSDPSTQVSTNLTFDVTSADSRNGVAVSLTDPNAATTIDGTATPSSGEREGGEREGGEREGGEREGGEREGGGERERDD